MSWATAHIAALQRGETVQFRPRGHSMRGKIESGQLVTVKPCDPAEVRVGDVVLCKVNGRQYLHLVKAVQGGRFQIGNNRGRVNGWVSGNGIYGLCVRVE
jgi:Peptidase S24-like